MKKHVCFKKSYFLFSLLAVLLTSCEVHIEDNDHHYQENVVGKWTFDQVLLDYGSNTVNITADYYDFVLDLYDDNYAKLRDRYTGQTFTGDWDVYYDGGHGGQSDYHLDLSLYDSFTGEQFNIRGMNLEIGGSFMYFDEEFDGDYYSYRLQRY